MQLEFEEVKKTIADSVQLIHFDPKKPAEIKTDTSIKVLGAALFQGGRPVKFLNKSLTQTEAEYSNIGREILPVPFACEKLHTYMFGCTINCDHKPLKIILKKSISLAPA